MSPIEPKDKDKDKEIADAFDHLIRMLVPGIGGTLDLSEIDCNFDLSPSFPITLREVSLSASGKLRVGEGLGMEPSPPEPPPNTTYAREGGEY